MATDPPGDPRVDLRSPWWARGGVRPSPPLPRFRGLGVLLIRGSVDGHAESSTAEFIGGPLRGCTQHRKLALQCLRA